MSAHVLLNLIHKLRISDKCSANHALYHFFATKQLNSMKISTMFDPKNTLKLLFLHENAKILPYICNIIMGVNT